MNPFPRDGFNWVKNFQSRKICGDFLGQKEFQILFLAIWDTFEAHGASWSVHHQQTPLLLGVELVDIEMVARPRCQVASCWLLGKSLSSFTKRVGWYMFHWSEAKVWYNCGKCVCILMHEVSCTHWKLYWPVDEYHEHLGFYCNVLKLKERDTWL